MIFRIATGLYSKPTASRAIVSMAVSLLFLAASAAHARDGEKQVMIEARIISVSTGDSMQVLDDFDLKDLQLVGAECPAGDQPFAAEARAFTRGRVSDRELPIVIFGTDEHGRLHGDIRLPGDTTLARELIREGLAAWDHFGNPNPALGALETQARTERRGMWQIPQLSRLPALGGAFAGPDGGDVDAIARAILMLSPGDRARLSARLGGGLPGSGQTVIRQPGQVNDGARIIRSGSARSSDFGIGVGDDGIRLRGGASEHTHTQDTQIEILGGSGGTLVIEEGGSYGTRHGRAEIVYLDGSGGYHRGHCFGDGPRGKAFSRSDAIARGYRPCPKCRP